MANLLKINRETVIKLWDTSLEEYNEFGKIPQWAEEVDWKYLEQELKTVPRKILYEELKEFTAVPSYQAFCQYLRNHKTTTTPAHISVNPPVYTIWRREIWVRSEGRPAGQGPIPYRGESGRFCNSGHIREEWGAVPPYAGIPRYGEDILLGSPYSDGTPLL